MKPHTLNEDLTEEDLENMKENLVEALESLVDAGYGMDDIIYRNIEMRVNEIDQKLDN